MNARERFLACMRCEPLDRALNWEMGYWAGTLERWYAEGLERDPGPRRPGARRRVKGRASWRRGEPRDSAVHRALRLDKGIEKIDGEWASGRPLSVRCSGRRRAHPGAPARRHRGRAAQRLGQPAPRRRLAGKGPRLLGGAQGRAPAPRGPRPPPGRLGRPGGRLPRQTGRSSWAAPSWACSRRCAPCSASRTRCTCSLTTRPSCTTSWRTSPPCGWRL